MPRWRGDGRELFYMDGARGVASVPIEVQDGAIAPGVPKVLFTLPVRGQAGAIRFDVSRDGQRFVYVAPLSETAVPKITVVLNWAPALATR